MDTTQPTQTNAQLLAEFLFSLHLESDSVEVHLPVDFVPTVDLMVMGAGCDNVYLRRGDKTKELRFIFSVRRFRATSGMNWLDSIPKQDLVMALDMALPNAERLAKFIGLLDWTAPSYQIFVPAHDGQEICYIVLERRANSSGSTITAMLFGKVPRSTIGAPVMTFKDDILVDDNVHLLQRLRSIPTDVFRQGILQAEVTYQLG